METILFVLITTLPSHIIAFYQFWDFPWRSRTLALVLVALHVCLKTFAVYLALCGGLHIRVLEFAFSLIGLAIYLCLLRTDINATLFFFVLVMDYLIVVRGIATFASAWAFHSSSQSYVSSLICLLLYLLTLPPVLSLCRHRTEILFQHRASGLWRGFFLLLLSMTAIILLFTDAFDASSVQSWSFFFARIGLSACILFAYALMLKALENIRHQAVLEEQANQIQRILQTQRSMYAHQSAYLEELRRARHDLRQHEYMIQSYLNSGDPSRLRQYLQTYLADLPHVADQHYCKNPSLDALMRFYAGRIREAGIRLEAEFSLPEALPFPEPDLCVVLGNLLENAQEACSGLENPYIRVAAKLTAANAFVLLVENSAPTPPRQRADGSLLSTKREGAGIGTGSVRLLAQEHGGMAEFRWEEGVFQASVFLPG